MADRPLENELMMTTYTQIGQELAADLDHLDVFVPSGVEENELGFDMQLPNLKGIVFQFKRPKDSRPRRFSVRYTSQDPPRQLDRMLNWELKFGPNVAFYALPLVANHDNLGQTLQQTAFIPASEIDPRASVIRIPEDFIEDGTRVGTANITVYCSNPDNPSINWSASIPASAVLGWKELETAISGCEAGFRLRWHDQSYYEKYHDGHRWYPRPPDDRDRDDLEDYHEDDHWHRQYDDDETEEYLDEIPPQARFVGLQGPMFTRFGTKGAFSW